MTLMQAIMIYDILRRNLDEVKMKYDGARALLDTHGIEKEEADATMSRLLNEMMEAAKLVKAFQQIEVIKEVKP